MILCSACLYGLKCRYDGKSKPAGESVFAELGDEPLLLCCPEQMGGLPTPRPPAELEGGDGFAVLEGRAKVVRANGEDVTEEFLAGAERTVYLAKKLGITRAIVKSKSPSCGLTHHYENGVLVNGPGVTVAALLQAGIEVEER